MRYSNFVAIFELSDINLVFEIFISTWLADLKKSASSTVRPKLFRRIARADVGLPAGSLYFWVPMDLMQPNATQIFSQSQLAIVKVSAWRLQHNAPNIVLY